MNSNRKVLIEQLTANKLTYIAESGIREDNKHYIGRLEGVAADLVNPTRNGRKYGLKLWMNVQNSEEFREGMETHTIFGEADHPEDRLETSIKEVAVCLRKFEIRESEGVVWCSFDILDTPNGRIIKELLDYGSILGVSSRGSGDEIEVGGETIVDPDTYIFICFDVVILPAVKAARPARVESVDRTKTKKLCESIETEIKNSSSLKDVEFIKSIIESQNIPVTDSLKESLNKRLSEFKSGDDISSKLLSELESATKQIEKLTTENQNLSKKLSAGESRLSESLRIISDMKTNAKRFKEALKIKTSTINNLYEEIDQNVEQYNDCIDEIDKLRDLNEDLRRRNSSLKETCKTYESDLKMLESRNSELSLQLESFNSNSDRHMKMLESKNSNLVNNCKENQQEIKTLTESNERLVSESKSLRESNSKLFELYKKDVCSFNGIRLDDPRIVECKNPKSLKSTVKAIVEEQDRLSRLPIRLGDGMSSKIKVVSESLNRSQDPEDAQTAEILSGIKK